MVEAMIVIIGGIGMTATGITDRIEIGIVHAVDRVVEVEIIGGIEVVIIMQINGEWIGIEEEIGIMIGEIEGIGVLVGIQGGTVAQRGILQIIEEAE